MIGSTSRTNCHVLHSSPRRRLSEAQTFLTRQGGGTAYFGLTLAPPFPLTHFTALALSAGIAALVTYDIVGVQRKGGVLAHLMFGGKTYPQCDVPAERINRGSIRRSTTAMNE